MVGQFYSSEYELTRKAIEEAKGGVLFIDEAYDLYRPNDAKDPGINVINALLTNMGDGNECDWALLLAGYTDGMMGMLTMNQGLSSRIPDSNRYHFKDYNVEELMQIACSYCDEHSYFLTSEARKNLEMKISHDYHLRDKEFGNARYVVSLLNSKVLQSMASRISRIKSPSLFDLITIKKEDIPAVGLKGYENPLKKLRGMVGMGNLKKSIENHLNMVKFMILRNEQGIETAMPPLHMVFTGNPGTGKTTVASFIGEIYASLGLLSKGDVVYVERKDLVGQYIGDTEKNTVEVLKRAKGNVLFIDEAYTLVPKGSANDFGPRVFEVLLSTLSKENIDMLVILAGYQNEMEELLTINPGLKSRIPYTFHFADYNAEELMQIAEGLVQKSKLRFSPAARKSLKELIDFKLSSKDAYWGNARFITRLISAHILPAMSNRIAALPLSKQKSKRYLSVICKEDIPSCNKEITTAEQETFDETIVCRALKKLDSLVGLEQVKQNIHNFVEIVRYTNSNGGAYGYNEPLRWNFTGNTGTGKSTVAGIMGELLKGMHLLEKGHLVEVKAEEIYNSSEFKADELLSKAMKRSNHGLLFIDGDSPLFKQPSSLFSSESLRFKLSSMTMELPGRYAFIIAENDRDCHVLSRNLTDNGINSFDHTLHFADYNEEELLSILKSCLLRKRLKLSDQAASHLSVYIHALCNNRELGYANARTMSKIAKAIAEQYILRVSTQKCKDNKQVTLEDVRGFVWNENLCSKRIGYR